MPSATLVIPALNEERCIGATIETVLGVARRLPGMAVEAIVIDDGSQDGTAAVVSRYAREYPQVRLIQHPVNQGLGCVVRTALAQATGEKFMIVPGDNDMSADTIHDLLAHAGAADLVMCYFPDRKSRGRGRQLLSALFASGYRMAFGIRVEYLNGPCLYPLARLQNLPLHSTRFSIVAEINVKLLRQGVSYVELPGQRQKGTSTSFSWRNFVETVRVFGRLCWELRIANRAQYAARPRRLSLDRPDPTPHP